MNLLVCLILLSAPAPAALQQTQGVGQLESLLIAPTTTSPAIVVPCAATVEEAEDGLGGNFAFTYCTAGINSTGHAAFISYAGSLNLLDNSFTLVASGSPVIPNSFGMFTYGLDQYNVPFGNGYLCVSPFGPGIFRMHTQNLNATVVQRAMAAAPADFQAFTLGSSWNFQFWYRDPTAGGALFNLSDALHVDFAPAP